MTRIPAADAVYVNGKVYTANAHDDVVEAFAVSGDSFIAAGTTAHVMRSATPRSKVVDLHGSFVSPGLTDAHFHHEGGGSGVDLSQVRSLHALLTTVAGAAQIAPSDALIVSNSDWHEAQLQEQRLPTAGEIDAVVPDKPVVLVRGGHCYVLNSAALKKWSITRNTPAPEGGSIPVDDSGALTGALIDSAMRLVSLPPRKPLSAADILATQKALNPFGITAVRIPGSYKGDLLTAYRLLQEVHAAERLTLRYIIYLPGFALRTVEQVHQLLAKWNVDQDQGNDWIRIGGVKLFVDGGFEGAHMCQPYEEPYGKNGTYFGLTWLPPDQYSTVVRELNRLGWRPATHAVGDAAIEQVLDAYEAANRDQPIADKRWSIEHAFIGRPDLLTRLKNLNIMISVQDHLYLAAPVLKRYWGWDRASKVTPVKDYLDVGQLVEKGLLVAGGTDSPIVPFNPFWELYHFMTRETISDGVYGVEQRISSRTQLLRLVTINYATLIGEQARKGSIEPGKLADFAVLTEDFLTATPEKIRDMKASATYVGGRQVYPEPRSGN